MSGSRRWIAPALMVAAVFALALSACGDSDSDSSSAATSGESSSGEGSSSGGSAALEAAEAQVEEAYAGRYTEPPSKSSPAAAGKDVWFISPGQASANASVAYEGVEEAAREIGWQLTLFDGKLDPSRPPEGIRQAVAAGADGIIVFAIDCSTAKSAYEVAKKAEVAVVSEAAFDCNETEPGAESLFSAPISLGERYESFPAAYQAWGSDLAAWTIGETDGRANLINTTNDQYALITELVTGYTDRITECPECTVTEMPWVVEEVGAKLAAKVQAEILKNPEANALQNSNSPQLGMAQGIVQSGKAGEIMGVGGLGLPEDVALLREEGKGLSVIGAWPIDWWSWAAIDTLNSIFNGEEPEDSGLGWQLIDSEHNLPKGEQFVPDVDFKAPYLARWGK